jgi:hypothetical protein
VGALACRESDAKEFSNENLELGVRSVSPEQGRDSMGLPEAPVRPEAPGRPNLHRHGPAYAGPDPNGPGHVRVKTT